MKKNLKISAILIPYLIITGLAYELGYWNNFDINPLAYVSLSELATIAIFPISVTLFFALFGYIIPSVTSHPSGSGQETYIGKFLNKYKKAISLIYSLTILFLLARYESNYKAWLILPVLIASAIYLQFLSSYHQDIFQGASHSILLFLIMLPLQSFGLGKYDAGLVLQNEHYQYVFKNDLKNPINSTLQSNEKYKFLGKIGQFLFFSSLDNKKIIISNLKDITYLQLIVSSEKCQR